MPVPGVQRVRYRAPAPHEHLHHCLLLQLDPASHDFLGYVRVGLGLNSINSQLHGLFVLLIILNCTAKDCLVLKVSANWKLSSLICQMLASSTR